MQEGQWGGSRCREGRRRHREPLHTPQASPPSLQTHWNPSPRSQEPSLSIQASPENTDARTHSQEELSACEKREGSQGPQPGDSTHPCCRHHPVSPSLQQSVASGLAATTGAGAWPAPSTRDGTDQPLPSRQSRSPGILPQQAVPLCQVAHSPAPGHVSCRGRRWKQLGH